MKAKIIIFMMVLMALPLGVWAGVKGGARVSRIKKASPAVYADVEMPFRCVLPNTDKQISNTIVLSPDDFSFVPLQKGDPLPRYSVNGYTFKEKPADAVFAELVKPADIKLLAPQTEYTLLEGEKIRGELSAVIEQLADTAEVFYSYKNSTKTLTLLPRAEFALNIPQNKMVLLAILDALRGHEIQNINVDWEKYQIRLTVSPDELAKAKKLVRQILSDSYLLAAEIEAYQAAPYAGQGEWQGILNESVNILASTGRAVVGRYAILKSKTDVSSFLSKVGKVYNLTPLVGGETVVPNGWRMRFNVNECSNNALPFPNMAVVMKTRIKDESSERTQVTLYSDTGVISSFDIASALNQEVVLFGIPSKVGNVELLFTLKFNLIRFVQKGELK